MSNIYLSRRSHRTCSVKTDVLKDFAKFTGKHLCQSPQACNFIKKETLAQVVSFEFCEIFKNTYLMERLQMTASVHLFYDFLD